MIHHEKYEVLVR